MATDRLRKKISKGRHASTIKRTRQSLKRRARNKQALSRMRTAIKKVRASHSRDALALAIPIIARTAAKGIIHRKAASRIISRLTRATQSPAAS